MKLIALHFIYSKFSKWYPTLCLGNALTPTAFIKNLQKFHRPVNFLKIPFIYQALKCKKSSHTVIRNYLLVLLAKIRAYSFIQETLCCVKSVQIQSYFWSVFSCFQSEHRKIRTRNNSVFGHFSRTLFSYLSDCQQKLKANTVFSSNSDLIEVIIHE